MSALLDTFLKKGKESSFFLLNTKEEDDGVFIIKEQLTHAHSKISPRIIDEADILPEIDAFSLFEENKIGIVPHAEKIKANFVKELQKRTPSFPLIFVGSAMRAQHPLYQWLAEKKAVLDLATETKSSREARVIKQVSLIARAFDKKIKNETICFLMGIVGDDLQLLSGEIHKLSAFIGDREEITVADIKTLTSNTKEESIWKFIDAILQRNGAIALHIGKKMLRDGFSFFVMLRHMRTALQTELQVLSLLPHGNVAIQAQFPYMRGSILEQHKSNAARLGESYLQNALIMIDKTDLLSKNGVDDHELLIELTIAKLC